MTWEDMVVRVFETLGFGALLGAVATQLVHGYLDRRETAQRRADDRRADVLAAAYGRLYDLRCALEHAATPDAAGEEAARRHQAAGDAGNLFRTEFQRSRFWFEPKTCELFDEYWEVAKGAGYAFKDADTGNNLVENRKNGREALYKKLPGLQARLEAEIRRVLKAS